MRLWCHDDPRKWGQYIAREAEARGHDAQVFAWGAEIEGDYAFYRLDQRFPAVELQRAHAEAIAVKMTLVPDVRMIRHYEDKWIQTEAFWRWLPETHLIASAEQARNVLTFMPLPFISKSKRGSASKNVRMIETLAAAEGEIALAFGNGLPAWGEAQRDYLIWQEICPANRYDYRVNIVGREVAIARRWNKPDTIFASGYSKIDNVNPTEDEPAEVLAFAKRFFDAERITFAAVDIVKGREGWRLLETSIAWPEHHLPWQSRNFLSGRPCRDLFAVIVEEMQAGAFDAAPSAAA